MAGTGGNGLGIDVLVDVDGSQCPSTTGMVLDVVAIILRYLALLGTHNWVGHVVDGSQHTQQRGSLWGREHRESRTASD